MAIFRALGDHLRGRRMLRCCPAARILLLNVPPESAHHREPFCLVRVTLADDWLIAAGTCRDHRHGSTCKPSLSAAALGFRKANTGFLLCRLKAWITEQRAIICAPKAIGELLFRLPCQPYLHTSCAPIPLNGHALASAWRCALQDLHTPDEVASCE